MVSGRGQISTDPGKSAWVEEKDMLEIVDIRDATEEEMKQFSQETEKETQIPQWQESMLRVFLANH